MRAGAGRGTTVAAATRDVAARVRRPPVGSQPPRAIRVYIRLRVAAFRSRFVVASGMYVALSHIYLSRTGP